MDDTVSIGWERWEEGKKGAGSEGEKRERGREMYGGEEEM